MKAVRFHEFGGPEVLKYEDVPDIMPRKDQVLVRVQRIAGSEAAAHQWQ
jgi:NADPH:quinone reductase-like Zn-dependent oxidoreductase